MELSILQHTKDNHPQKIGISEVVTRIRDDHWPPGYQPVLLVQALSDTVVPPEENGLPFLERLRAAGGTIELIEKPGADHHPHSLDPPDRIVDFIERHRP